MRAVCGVVLVLAVVLPLTAHCASDRAARLVELANQRFGELTPAETKMLHAAAAGLMAQCAKKDDDIDPAKAASWDADRVIHADRIAWLCTDPEGSAYVSFHGILIGAARIEGGLDLAYAEVKFPLGLANSALPEEVALRESHLKTLFLIGTHVRSIAADGAKVDGAVFLKNGFKADGQVRLAGATIGGNLGCESGTFNNPHGYALNADGIRVRGGVFLGDGFKADGEVHLVGATIGGNFECQGGAFNNPGGNALIADNLRVEGSVFMQQGFQANGRVQLVGASVGRYFIWWRVASPQLARLDLRSARIGMFVDDEASWPAPGNLLLQGLTYNEFGSWTGVSVAGRKNWLRLQPPGSFAPQPYEQLAKVLRESGDEEGAKEILIAKNEERSSGMSQPGRLLHWLLGVTTGYGYRPWRAFWWGLAVMALGRGLFSAGFRTGAMVCTKATSDYRPAPCPLFYSIDAFVPLVEFYQTEYWRPDGGKGFRILPWGHGPTFGTVLCIYLWVHILVGWILTTLLVVGLTGLIRA